MATKTTHLSLEKPGLGEYTNAWHTPLNNNFQKIDDWATTTDEILADARGTQATLNDRLSQGMDSDGTLKPTAEVLNARNSFLYGNAISSVVVDDFSDINVLRDKEIWKARQGTTSILKGIGHVQSYGTSTILSGSKDIKGEPAWAGSTANKIAADGSVVPLMLNIAGKASRVSVRKEYTLPSAGTHYVYATYQEDGTSILSGTAGSTGYMEGADPVLDNCRIFQDVTKDFTSTSVKVGDVLRISTTSTAGDYVIAEIAPGTTPVVTNLKIVGRFPGPLPVSSLTYEIRDPMDIVLGSVISESLLPADSMFLMDAVSDGSSVTSYTPRHFGTTYVGDWRSVDVSTVTTFEEIWNHRLGSEDLQVVVQARATGSEWVEELCSLRLGNNLSVATDGSGLSVAVNTSGLTGTLGTLSTASALPTPDTHNHNVTGTPGVSGTATATISGSATSTIGGSVYPENSALTAFSRNKIKVKNAVASKFFKDYDGVARTSGSIRVIVTKRG